MSTIEHTTSTGQCSAVSIEIQNYSYISVYTSHMYEIYTSSNRTVIVTYCKKLLMSYTQIFIYWLLVS